ncbi:hypothetical protein HX787_25060 [Pseudomonas tolaasii]|uniref:RiboL-PSP-HEPN domain-containing protein n=2 Tax=Pseudomonas tolaasii TaxID=29442 RepID=A0A7Y8ARQ3_PSETO|nr:HEPN domain-containing protein [Pseudomonas tolaasii]ARB27678.1 hypothetical protein B5P22_10480 [Pseudomonas tolaasii]KAB0475280.1 hypothetical protein F7R12_12020 [Pseudomonas tolaasii]MBY8942348.1 hypothetical protein [Pseudomonas tolaasii]NWC23157.1 hypothetical protein [Pseudomonas tolaasii]NWC39643.1 hypothetical protein [Pseudomonas tolaasii]
MDVVHMLYSQVRELDDFLLGNGEVSLKSVADSNFRKSILLASASFFEKEVTDLVLDYTKKITNNDSRLVSFVHKKGLTRQYHSLFSWEAKNCNAFYALFGEEFKAYFSDLVNQDQALEGAVKSFIEVGAERNRLVHQNFGSYTIEKTSEEIFGMHTNALRFVQKLREALDLKATE